MSPRGTYDTTTSLLPLRLRRHVQAYTALWEGLCEEFATGAGKSQTHNSFFMQLCNPLLHRRVAMPPCGSVQTNSRMVDAPVMAALRFFALL